MATMFKLQKTNETCCGSVLSKPLDICGLQHPQRQQHNFGSPYIVTTLFPAVPYRLLFPRVENVILAAAYAREINRPLAYNLTIKSPPNASNPAMLFETIRKKLSEWLHNNDNLAAFVWTEEANDGPHIHILLHVSKEEKPKCAQMVRKWLQDALDVKHLPSRTMKFTLIDSSGNSDEQIRTRVRYILKRADDKTRLFFNIDTKYDLGPTTGSKAIGVSQAIGENARKRTGGVQSSGCRGVSAEMLKVATISNLERSSHDRC